MRIPSDSDDLVSLICWETGSLGTEERPVGSFCLASFYFPRETSIAETERHILQVCSDHGIQPEGFETSLVEAPPDLWMAKFREHFQGIRVGEFFVRPPWIDGSAGGIDIQIDPSHAFGTGTHESTQLILENLRPIVAGMRQLLDVGTGSGILALSAARLAPELTRLGIDVDPYTIPVAARNAALNAIDLPLLVCGPESLEETFDLVLANLTGPVIVHLAAHLTRLAGSRLVTSGVTFDEANLVRESILASEGWEEAERFQKGDWVCFVFRFVPPPGSPASRPSA